MSSNYKKIIHGVTFLIALLLAACGGGSSSDANLSGLTISTGVLAPAFNSSTLAYTVDVSNATTFVIITPTASSANATITANNVIVTSSSATNAIALTVGPNPINVVVTAQDGTTIKTYTITVTRAASADATLASLNVNPWPIYPAFNPATVAYNLPLPAMIASVDVGATVADANATMTINGAAAVSDLLTFVPISVPVGQSAIPIVVTAQDGITTKSYVITVIRSDIDLSPSSSTIAAFNSVTMTVTLETVPSTDTVVTLTSSAPSVVTVPANVTVLAGATQATFSATSVASGAGLFNVI